jgi:hypothetical protein
MHTLHRPLFVDSEALEFGQMEITSRKSCIKNLRILSDLKLYLARHDPRHRFQEDILAV